MSYAWLLPPLCDPVDGHLLMDGCYVNNVPGRGFFPPSSLLNRNFKPLRGNEGREGVIYQEFLEMQPLIFRAEKKIHRMIQGDVMAAQGCKYILAVDVTTLDDRDLTNYGDHLSGWWLLWNKVNIFAAPIKIPTQADIQLRLAFWYVRL